MDAQVSQIIYQLSFVSPVKHLVFDDSVIQI